MKPQILISIMVLIGTLIVGFSGVRFFPFSNYPMFSYRVQDLSTYTLTIQQKEGPDILIENRTLFPLTRLNLTQAIWMTKKEHLPNYEWAKFLMERVKKKYPTAEQLSLQKIEFTDPLKPTTNYRVIETIWTTQ